MSFTLKPFEVDLGTTDIENMFIQEFMPQANGTYVKVYLLGLYYARNPKALYTNETIAKHLEISLEDVCAAWSFWQGRGIVDCTPPENPYTPHSFSVQFLSVREIYLSHNYAQQPIGGEGNTTGAKQSNKASVSSSANRVISALSNPELKKMFQQIEYIIKRPITPANYIRILDWMTNYRMDPDMIERAFAITYEERPKLQEEPNIDRHFKYIESILASWFDKKIFSAKALEAEEAKHQSKALHYKQVYAAIGVINRAVSAGDREIIDQWSTQLDSETQLLIIKEATKRTTNPNLKYIDRIIQSALQSGVTDLPTAEAYFDHQGRMLEERSEKQRAAATTPASSPNTSKPKRPAQNFSQSTIASLSAEELNSILRRKSERKKTTTEGKS